MSNFVTANFLYIARHLNNHRTQTRSCLIEDYRHRGRNRKVSGEIASQSVHRNILAIKEKVKVSNSNLATTDWNWWRINITSFITKATELWFGLYVTFCLISIALIRKLLENPVLFVQISTQATNFSIENSSKTHRGLGYVSPHHDVLAGLFVRHLNSLCWSHCVEVSAVWLLEATMKICFCRFSQNSWMPEVSGFVWGALRCDIELYFSISEWRNRIFPGGCLNEFTAEYACVEINFSARIDQAAFEGNEESFLSRSSDQ